MAQSLFWGQTYLGGSWVPKVRGKSDSKAPGQDSGGRLAQVWVWAPLFSLWRQGKWGESTGSWPWCPAFCCGSLTWQYVSDLMGPPAARIGGLWVGAWIPLLPGHRAVSFQMFPDIQQA